MALDLLAIGIVIGSHAWLLAGEGAVLAGAMALEAPVLGASLTTVVSARSADRVLAVLVTTSLAASVDVGAACGAFLVIGASDAVTAAIWAVVAGCVLVRVT